MQVGWADVLDVLVRDGVPKSCAGPDGRPRPPVPLGRRVALEGRGTTFVREVAGPPHTPTLVLLHGWMASGGLNWFRTFELLAEDFHVIAPDLRGHAADCGRATPLGLPTAPTTLPRCSMSSRSGRWWSPGTPWADRWLSSPAPPSREGEGPRALRDGSLVSRRHAGGPTDRRGAWDSRRRRPARRSSRRCRPRRWSGTLAAAVTLARLRAVDDLGVPPPRPAPSRRSRRVRPPRSTRVLGSGTLTYRLRSWSRPATGSFRLIDSWRPQH